MSTTTEPRFASRAMTAGAQAYAEQIAAALTEDHPTPTEKALWSRYLSWLAFLPPHIEGLANLLTDAGMGDVEGQRKESLTCTALVALMARGYDPAKVAPCDHLPLMVALFNGENA